MSCFGRMSSRNPTPHPATGTKLSSDEVLQIIRNGLRLSDDRIKCADGIYMAYPLNALTTFLLHDVADKFKYKKERFDCDDFAFVVLGREREWFGQGEDRIHNPTNVNDPNANDATANNDTTSAGGSTFGFVWGDIRNSETDATRRPHAINFFIDDKKELWLIEPQNDRFFKPTSNSTFWLAVV